MERDDQEGDHEEDNEKADEQDNKGRGKPLRVPRKDPAKIKDEKQLRDKDSRKGAASGERERRSRSKEPRRRYKKESEKVYNEFAPFCYGYGNEGVCPREAKGGHCTFKHWDKQRTIDWHYDNTTRKLLNEEREREDRDRERKGYALPNAHQQYRGRDEENQDRSYRNRDDASVSSGGSGSKRKNDQRQGHYNDDTRERSPKRDRSASYQKSVKDFPAIQTEEEKLKRRTENLQKELKETEEKLKKIEQDKGKEVETGKALLSELKTRVGDYDVRLQKAHYSAASICDLDHYEVLRTLEETRFLVTVWWRRMKKIEYDAWLAVHSISLERELDDSLQQIKAKFEKFGSDTRKELKELFDTIVSEAEAELHAQRGISKDAFDEYNRLHKETYAAVAQETLMGTYDKHFYHDERNGSKDDQDNFIPCDEFEPTYVSLAWLQDEAQRERERMRKKVEFLTEEMEKRDERRIYRLPNNMMRDRSASPNFPHAARSRSREAVKKEKVKDESPARADARENGNERRGASNEKLKREDRGSRKAETSDESRVKREDKKGPGATKKSPKDCKPKVERDKESPGKPPIYVPKSLVPAVSQTQPGSKESSKSMSIDAVRESKDDPKREYAEVANLNKEPVRTPQISENEGEEDDQKPSSRKDPTQSEGSQDDANSNDGEKQAEGGSESDAQSAKDNESGASDGEEEEERGEISDKDEPHNDRQLNNTRGQSSDSNDESEGDKVDAEGDEEDEGDKDRVAAEVTIVQPPEGAAPEKNRREQRKEKEALAKERKAQKRQLQKEKKAIAKKEEYRKQMAELDAHNAEVDRKRKEKEDEELHLALVESMKVAALEEEKRAKEAAEQERLTAEALGLSAESEARKQQSQSSSASLKSAKQLVSFALGTDNPGQEEKRKEEQKAKEAEVRQKVEERQDHQVDKPRAKDNNGGKPEQNKDAPAKSNATNKDETQSQKRAQAAKKSTEEKAKEIDAGKPDHKEQTKELKVDEVVVKPTSITKHIKGAQAALADEKTESEEDKLKKQREIGEAVTKRRQERQNQKIMENKDKDKEAPVSNEKPVINGKEEAPVDPPMKIKEKKVLDEAEEKRKRKEREKVAAENREARRVESLRRAVSGGVSSSSTPDRGAKPKLKPSDKEEERHKREKDAPKVTVIEDAAVEEKPKGK